VVVQPVDHQPALDLPRRAAAARAAGGGADGAAAAAQRRGQGAAADPRGRGLLAADRLRRARVYKPRREVRHPKTGKRLGHIVEILGEAEVRSVTDGNIARCVVVDSVDPIERGYLVGPLRRQFKVVDPRPDRGDLEGAVVATIRPSELVGADMIVFLDRGEKDGVELGNRFFVTRRGDGYQPLLARGAVDDKRYPRENIAEILVVDLRERLSTGFVIRSTKEAQIGDRVEARKGY
jgi:hypothetical protein